MSKTREQRLDLIKNFFASALEPEPEIASQEVPLKEVCLQHVMALYFVINDPEQLKAAHIPDTIIAAVAGKDLERLKDQPLETITKALKEMDPSFFTEMQAALDKAIEDFRFETGALSAISLPKLGEAWTQFFQNILENYFPQLSLKDRKHVLAYMISKMPENPDDIDRLLNAVHASGPYLHKYFQLMADKLEPANDAKLSKLRDGLLDVKNSLPPIPQRHIDAYVAELKAKGFELSNLESLGAASVGQAFKATLNGSREIVVKFRRPGIEEVAKREREFFNKMATMAQGEALRQSFDDIAAQIQEEFDYNVEYNKIQAGIKAYEHKGSPIHVVHPVEDFPRTERYFAMEYVDGVTFKKLGKNQLEKHVKGILWERLTKKFLNQAMFATENAFFHGDLHEGNIMVQGIRTCGLSEDVKREEVEKAINDGKIKLVLIDFGNAHELTQDQRSRIKNIFMAASKISNSAEALLEAMCDNGYPKDLIKELNQDIFAPKNEEKHPGWKIGQTMDKMLARDIAIPGFLMAFKRSLAMLIDIQDNNVPEEFRVHKQLEPVFQSPYVDNLPDLFSDPGSAADENAAAVLQNIVGGKVARFFFDEFRKVWDNKYFYKQAEPHSTDPAKRIDNYFEANLIHLGKSLGPKVSGLRDFARWNYIKETVRLAVSYPKSAAGIAATVVLVPSGAIWWWMLPTWLKIASPIVGLWEVSGFLTTDKPYTPVGLVRSAYNSISGWF